MKTVRVIVVVFVLIIIAVVVITTSRKGSTKRETPPLRPDSTGLEREVAVIGRRLVARRFDVVVAADGVLEAWNRTRLGSETGGRVRAWKVQIGEQLDSGEVILEFDDELSALRLKQAKSALEAARVSREKQRRDLEKFRQLFDSGNLSRTEIESAELAFKGAEAALAQAEAAFGVADRALRETRVRMPFKGLLASRIAVVGEDLPPGAPVAEVVQVDPIRLNIALSDRYILSVKPGQSATVKTTGWGDRVFTGRVHAVGVAADLRTRLFPVEIEIANPELELKPGMAASVEITVSTYPDALVIPMDIVSKGSESWHCYVAHGDRAERCALELGPGRAGMAVVRSGLSPGDTVIITGQQGLKPGQRIALRLEDDPLVSP